MATLFSIDRNALGNLGSVLGVICSARISRHSHLLRLVGVDDSTCLDIPSIGWLVF